MRWASRPRRTSRTKGDVVVRDFAGNATEAFAKVARAMTAVVVPLAPRGRLERLPSVTKGDVGAGPMVSPARIPGPPAQV